MTKKDNYTYQQDGRDAFECGEGYLPPIGLTKDQINNWKRGWREAARRAEEREQEEAWMSNFGRECPWHDDGNCEATVDECHRDRCAINYFFFSIGQNNEKTHNSFGLCSYSFSNRACILLWHDCRNAYPGSIWIINMIWIKGGTNDENQ